MESRGWVAAAVVAAGIAWGGWFVGHGFEKGRATDRYVTVKGISEREVKADVALWPLRFVATGNDLGQVRDELLRARGKVLGFLDGHGIDPEAAQVNALEVNDLLANPWRQEPVVNRYILAETLMVRSSDPDRIHAASQEVGDLVSAGVVLAAEGGPRGGPTYLFTTLSDLKPDMIAQATANARRAAAQFAEDSGSRLGGIRTANQGVFQILPRDQAPGVAEEQQVHKTVRVVATLEYFLVG